MKRFPYALNWFSKDINFSNWKIQWDSIKINNFISVILFEFPSKHDEK